MKLASLDRRLGAAIALATAASVGSDWSISLWSARAPWVPAVYQNVSVGASDLGLAALVTYSCVVATRAALPPLPARSLVVVVAGVSLLGSLAISAIGAIAPPLSIATTAEVGLGLAAYVSVVRRPRLAQWLLIGFGCLILLELPLSVLQETSQSRFPLAAILGPASGSYPASTPGAAVVVGLNGARWQRAMGSFPHPNVLGGFLAVALVLVLPSLERGGRGRLAALLTVWGAGWVELVLSFSRAALLAALVGCGVWLIGRHGRTRWRFSIAWLLVPPMAALVGATVVAGPFLQPRLEPTPAMLSTTPVSGRLMLGQVATSLILAHPLVGIGAGNFSLAELAPPYNAVAVDPVHVVPLLVAAEAGLPAGLAWLALVVGGPIVGWRHGGRAHPSSSWLALPVAVLTLALLDHYLWTLPAGRFVFWTGLAIWTVMEEGQRATAGIPVDVTGQISAAAPAVPQSGRDGGRSSDE